MYSDCCRVFFFGGWCLPLQMQVFASWPKCLRLQNDLFKETDQQRTKTSKKLTSKELKLRKSRTVGSVGFQPIPSWRSTAPSGLLCTWLHDVSKTNTTQHATRCGNDVMSLASTQHQNLCTENQFLKIYIAQNMHYFDFSHMRIFHTSHTCFKDSKHSPVMWNCHKWI